MAPSQQPGSSISRCERTESTDGWLSDRRSSATASYLACLAIHVPVHDAETAASPALDAAPTSSAMTIGARAFPLRQTLWSTTPHATDPLDFLDHSNEVRYGRRRILRRPEHCLYVRGKLILSRSFSLPTRDGSGRRRRSRSPERTARIVSRPVSSQALPGSATVRQRVPRRTLPRTPLRRP